ncbi:hypothetical protein CTI14_13035 [Methylobacterium radiotolerans]|nr:hypothetical protein CTI14_13035 [Methylobacterium radiotolerans]
MVQLSLRGVRRDRQPAHRVDGPPDPGQRFEQPYQTAPAWAWTSRRNSSNPGRSSTGASKPRTPPLPRHIKTKSGDNMRSQNTDRPRPSRRRFSTLLVALALSGVGAPAAHAAEPWPAKPITLIVPFPPGGTTDVTGRILARALSTQLGRTVIVENRAGASGNIGSAFVARAKPDGYTLLMSGVGTHAANAALYDAMPYDPIKDFTHISSITSSPNVIAVNPDFPATTLAELVSLLRKSPDKFNYASPGAGSRATLPSNCSSNGRTSRCSTSRTRARLRQSPTSSAGKSPSWSWWPIRWNRMCGQASFAYWLRRAPNAASCFRICPRRRIGIPRFRCRLMDRTVGARRLA